MNGECFPEFTNGWLLDENDIIVIYEHVKHSFNVYTIMLNVLGQYSNLFNRSVVSY